MPNSMGIELIQKPRWDPEGGLAYEYFQKVPGDGNNWVLVPLEPKPLLVDNMPVVTTDTPRPVMKATGIGTSMAGY